MALADACFMIANSWQTAVHAGATNSSQQAQLSHAAADGWKQQYCSSVWKLYVPAFMLSRLHA